MNPIEQIEQGQMRGDVPSFKPGDRVRVHVRIKEGEKERIQVFEGDVIARRGATSRETFTVRKVSYGVGVERVFPLHSPHIDKIELVTIGKVRRAKLYYLRKLRGKAARIKEDVEARYARAAAPRSEPEPEPEPDLEPETAGEAEANGEGSASEDG